MVFVVLKNRTPKNPNRSKTVSLSSVDFSSTKFSSLMRNRSKRTPIEIKFYTHLEQCVSKVFKNFELNRISKSIADIKVRSELGFCWGFLDGTQNVINLDHDQELHRLGVRSDPKSLSPHKSIPNST
jgi:hypothetical protein